LMPSLGIDLKKLGVILMSLSLCCPVLELT